MCGFVFIHSQDEKWLEERRIVQMANRIAHRGPDDHKTIVSHRDRVAMSHVRLSIIDLSPLGQQPMSTENGEISILFNGEIYNYIELRRELVDLGVSFKSKSDTEVLLKGYEKWNKDILNKINGMFAFVIFDRKKKVVLFARDRMGVKPLYYYLDKKMQTLVIFSELKSILANDLIERNIEEKAKEVYLKIGYIPAPLTIYKNVFKVKSSHYHEVDLSNFEVREKRYWSYVIGGNDHLRDSEIHDKIGGLLQESVSLRMRSDVPVGILLSGGVDSTLIASIASKISKNNLRTFSSAFDIGPRSFKYNLDADLAEETSRSLDATHTRLNIAYDSDFFKKTQSAIYFLDEPHYVATGFTQYLMSKKIRDSGVKVVLDGNGGDEVFGGYSRYFNDVKLEKFNLIPVRLRKFLLSLPALEASRLSRAIEKSLTQGSLSDRMVSWQSFFSNREINLLLGKKSYGNSAEELIEMEMGSMNFPSNQDAMLYFDQKFWLAEAQCMISDRMTMANGIEARSPFLDYRLVEFGMSLSFLRKTRRQDPKHSLKKSFDTSILPSRIKDRPKTGWFSPVHYWVKDYLWNEIGESIKDAVRKDFLDTSALDYIQEGAEFNAQKIWNLFVMSCWRTSFDAHL